jgi:hypothetical protein
MRAFAASDFFFRAGMRGVLYRRIGRFALRIFVAILPAWFSSAANVARLLLWMTEMMMAFAR